MYLCGPPHTALEWSGFCSGLWSHQGLGPFLVFVPLMPNLGWNSRWSINVVEWINFFYCIQREWQVKSLDCIILCLKFKKQEISYIIHSSSHLQVNYTFIMKCFSTLERSYFYVQFFSPKAFLSCFPPLNLVLPLLKSLFFISENVCSVTSVVSYSLRPYGL